MGSAMLWRILCRYFILIYYIHYDHMCITCIKDVDSSLMWGMIHILLETSFGHLPNNSDILTWYSTCWELSLRTAPVGRSTDWATVGSFAKRQYLVNTLRGGTARDVLVLLSWVLCRSLSGYCWVDCLWWVWRAMFCRLRVLLSIANWVL